MIDIVDMYLAAKVKADLLLLLMQVQDGCTKEETEEGLFQIIRDTADLEKNLADQLPGFKIS